MFGVMVFRTDGSLNSCSVPMMDDRVVSRNAGQIMGSLMLRAILTSPAPSSLAASYISRGTDCRAANRMIMLIPVYDQMLMFAIDQRTVTGASRFALIPMEVRNWIRGLMLGWYRKPHSRAAMTPGTASGRNTA